MFGKYMYLETPSLRIVRRIQVVQFIIEEEAEQSIEMYYQ